MRKKLITACVALLSFVGATASDFGKPLSWDRHSLIVDGRRVCPVMGEAPIYLPRETDRTPGERVENVVVMDNE